MSLAKKWIEPKKWTEEQVHSLVMDEVGIDILFPVGFELLVKLWMPPEDDGSGILSTDHGRRNERIMTRVGKIIRMGPEAFKDISRFPMGPRATYGDWIIFRSMERDLIRIGEHDLAHLHDDRVRLITTAPDLIKTSFDLEYEHNG
jgi:hypothetical protein